MNLRTQNSQRKTEILVITPTYAALRGGAALVVRELITVMSRRTPFHFTWVAHRDPHADIDSAPILSDVTDQYTAPPHTLQMQGWSFFEKLFRWRWPIWNKLSRKILRHAIVDTDLVWIHDTLYPGAWMAFAFARALSRPILITQHNSPVFYEHTGWLRRSWVNLLDRFITTPMLQKAQQVSFTCDAAARFYYGRVAFKATAYVIPSGVDAQIFHPPSADEYRNLRTRFALRDEQPVLLFSGRFEKAGGLSIIRNIAKAMPKWRFWLVGDGYSKPEAWYAPNVQVFRHRSGGSLAELYQAADLLLLPGYDPESPQILQQALACRLPIMCSPKVVSGNSAASGCLVVNVDTNSAENTAQLWVQKLKAGKDIWPTASENKTPFDSSWDWLQVAAHYTDLFQILVRTAP